ncbi:hypothetical protein B0H14DRAFT_3498202 [Mycena olivaceomarginata]|nr:hypothetical protein B0H14DRAFT_3498202 [Mycena olivaceomarginata]
MRRTSTEACVDGAEVACRAAIALPARWGASTDIKLTPHSAQMGINWQGDFEKYIKYLQNGLDKHKGSVLRIFREWDEIFFPEMGTSLAGNGTVNEGV